MKYCILFANLKEYNSDTCEEALSISSNNTIRGGPVANTCLQLDLSKRLLTSLILVVLLVEHMFTQGGSCVIHLEITLLIWTAGPS